MGPEEKLYLLPHSRKLLMTLFPLSEVVHYTSLNVYPMIEFLRGSNQKHLVM